MDSLSPEDWRTGNIDEDFDFTLDDLFQQDPDAANIAEGLSIRDAECPSDPIQDDYDTVLSDIDAEIQFWGKLKEASDPASGFTISWTRICCNELRIKPAFERFGEVKTQWKLFLKCLNDAVQIFQDEPWRSNNCGEIQSKIFNVFYALSGPLFLSMFEGWEHLVNPSHTELLPSWKALFQEDESDMNYCQLISDVLVPVFRSVGNIIWQAKDPNPMIKLIDVWGKLLPPSVLDTILEKAVFPKLLKVVCASLEPHLDTVPVDVWLRPWLPIMGDKLKNLHLVMSYKLALAIKNWSPNDDSVFAILSPWKSTFDQENWEKLMRNSVIPKLQLVLKEFQVNSRDVAAQKFDEFHWVTKWISHMPIHLVIDMLKEHFFPKWLRLLYDWLCSDPDFTQLGEWYVGWRDVLPQELRAYADIRVQLSNALRMIDQAIEGNKVRIKQVYNDILLNEWPSFHRNQ